MGLWPFRRKSTRRKSNSGAKISGPNADMHNATEGERHDGNEMSLHRKRTKKAVQAEREASRDARKLQRNPARRTYSFSPGRDDNLPVHRDTAQMHSNAIIHAQTWNSAGMIETARSEGLDGKKEWQRMPTLHKRKPQDMSRRKSSKRRKEDHDREAEVKAMSSSMPKRPTNFDSTTTPPRRKLSKQQKGSLNRESRNSSQNASPPAASGQSSISSTSDKHASYMLKGMFSPHPTIRYSENPRYVPGASGFGSPGSVRGRTKLADNVAIPEEVMRANKRVDNLADGLSAGDIRELMERDQRRKERKKVAEQQSMQRKLTRRAERQRAAEIEALRKGTEFPQNMDRGVLGREVVGLGIGNRVMDVHRSTSITPSQQHGKQPEDFIDSSPDVVQTIEHHRHESLPVSEVESTVDDHFVGTAQVARLSRASMSAPSSPNTQDKGTFNVPYVANLNAQERLVSEASESILEAEQPPESTARPSHSWTSFFRRGLKSKRNTTPSFSNTSRESAFASSAPTQALDIHRSTSSLPKRTMSRFREDLPEFPISPPDSRVQSPEADEVPPIHTGFPDKRAGPRASVELVDHPSRRHDTPTSGYRSHEPAARLQTETPGSGRRTSDLPSPEPTAVMSQSLASIDSEASWLSGRPRVGSKRGSAQHAIHQGAMSLEMRYREFSESGEETGIAEDEYFSRLTPGADEMFEKSHGRRVSGNPMPSSDEEEEDNAIGTPIAGTSKWGAVARQPTLIYRNTPVKSREGLLNSFDSDSESDDEATIGSPTSTVGEVLPSGGPFGSLAGIEKAKSVSLGKGHVRQVSAGSAKLLDVKPKSSGDIHVSSADKTTMD